VSRILGHKNPGITQVFYQHAIPCLEEDAISRFAALTRSSTPGSSCWIAAALRGCRRGESSKERGTGAASLYWHVRRFL
jgi:hypothetical protein